MLAVEESLNDHNYGGCHGFGQLIGTDSVELQREVCEHHEPTEGDGERENFEQGEALGRENVESGTDEQSEGGSQEVCEGEGHTREPIVEVDELVEEDYTDR